MKSYLLAKDSGVVTGGSDACGRNIESACAERPGSHLANPLRPSAQRATAISGRSATDIGFLGIRHLGLSWRHDIQSFHCDDLVFSHEGPTDTEPSHDLAHLLIAANGNLRWCPIGTDIDVRIAEYNAIFIEHLLDKAYNSIMYNSVKRTTILNDTLRHARWFVDEHFAPFPVSAEAAYERLCWNIDPTTISRHSPRFFDLRWRERTNPNCRETGVEIQFSRDDVPAATGKAKEFSHVVGDLLEGISRSSLDRTFRPLTADPEASRPGIRI
jgi:hypothetical protein